MVDSVKYLVEAGQRLIAKKETFKHGEWLPWLEANTDMLGFETQRTAQKLMTLATDAEAIRWNRVAWGNNVRGTEGTGSLLRQIRPFVIDRSRVRIPSLACQIISDLR